jgi:hypothetical protein
MPESRLKENAAAVKKLFGTAAKLAQKQAALATLNNVTLPKIYHAIGKKIVGLERLPPDLVTHRDKIRALEARIAARPEEPTTAPAEGFAAKAKQLAQQAAQKASKVSADAAATMQIQAAYVALGKGAVEKYGDKSVPKEILPELQAAKATISQLQEDIAALSASSHHGVFTPSRLLLVGGIGAAVVLCVTLLRSFRGDESRIEDGSNAQAVSTSRDTGQSASKEASLADADAKQSNSTFSWDETDSPKPVKRKSAKRQLPPELEEWRGAIAIVEGMYLDSGRRDVPTGELITTTQVLTSGFHGRPSEVQKQLRLLAMTSRDTKTDIESLVKQMRETLAATSSRGFLGPQWKNYSGLDATPESQSGLMLCPTCRGTGNTNPDNPANGATCVLCGGSGRRKIGE